MAINVNTKYPGRVNAPDANYPTGSIKNETVPGSSDDGTPLDEDWGNDFEGAKQALIRAGGITLSGNPDTGIDSQILQGVVQQAMGRAYNFDDTGIVNAYIAELRTNQQGPGVLFDGMVFKLTPNVTNTAASTIDVSDLLGQVAGTTVLNIKLAGGVTDPSAGDVSATSEQTFIYRAAPSAHAEIQINTGVMPLGYISGIVPSLAADVDHDVTLSIGKCRDSLDSVDIELTSAITKQIDAAWAAGDNAGGLFSGTVAVDTTYHMFLIVNDSDGSVDAGFDTSLTAANIPAGYTAYRNVYSGKTDASGNWIAFTATEISGGDLEISYNTNTLEVSTTAPGIVRNTLPLSVPTGIKLMAHLRCYFGNNTFSQMNVVDLTTTDIAPAQGNCDVSNGPNINERSAFAVSRMTDASGQVGYRATTNTGYFSPGITIRTMGYRLYR